MIFSTRIKEKKKKVILHINKLAIGFIIPIGEEKQ
jgi:hypothetical protein